MGNGVFVLVCELARLCSHLVHLVPKCSCAPQSPLARFRARGLLCLSVVYAGLLGCGLGG